MFIKQLLTVALGDMPDLYIPLSGELRRSAIRVLADLVEHVDADVSTSVFVDLYRKHRFELTKLQQIVDVANLYKAKISREQIAMLVQDTAAQINTSVVISSVE